MANHKRKRPRSNTRGGRFDRWKAKKLGDEYRWLNNWPAWWDIVFHRRPHRRKADKLTRAVFLGKVEADNAAWPVHKKPHRYFW